jgi:hypothetical protein
MIIAVIVTGMNMHKHRMSGIVLSHTPDVKRGRLHTWRVDKSDTPWYELIYFKYGKAKSLIPYCCGVEQCI